MDVTLRSVREITVVVVKQ